MSSGANFFLKKTLGEDFLQSLEKFELWKMGTKTVVDPEEIKIALKIVPRTLMSMLIHNLTSMEIGDTKEIEIPVESSSPHQAMVRVNKHERDVYSGEIEQGNKKIAEFKYRSIPGVGLVIMSALELYDVERLNDHSKDHSMEMEHKVQRMIDDRLALHDLIGKVVDKKLSEREAIQKVILHKLTEELHREKEGVGPSEQVRQLHETQDELRKENKKLKKKLALNEFLEERKKKLHKKEHPISLSKGEHVSCPDCGKNIFDGTVFAGCICYGDDMDKKLYITKSEGGVKVRFGKGWDPENIEMLLDVLRGKRG